MSRFVAPEDCTTTEGYLVTTEGFLASVQPLNIQQMLRLFFYRDNHPYMTKLHWVNSIKIKINYDSNWGGLFVVKLGSIWTDLGEKVA